MSQPSATRETLKAIDRFASGKSKVLISKALPNSQRTVLKLRADLADEGCPVFDSEIPHLTAFHDASSAAVCVSDLKGVYALRAWQAYEAIGRQIYTRELVQGGVA